MKENRIRSEKRGKIRIIENKRLGNVEGKRGTYVKKIITTENGEKTKAERKGKVKNEK